MPLTQDQLVRLAYTSATGFVRAIAASITELTGGGATTLHSHAGGGGAATPQTATVTITTDANTFHVEHVFDLVHATTAYIKATILVLTPDSEVFGDGNGDIQVDIGFNPETLAGTGISRDGVTYIAASFTGIHTVPATAVSAILDGSCVVPRFLNPCVFIYDVSSGLFYAGANHPTAQVRLDIEYL